MTTFSYRKVFLKYAFPICTLLSMTACKKFNAVPTSSNALNGPSVFSSNNTAVAVINGLYVRMTDDKYLQGSSGVSILGALSSDELNLYANYNGTLRSFYQNNLSNQVGSDNWVYYYSYIYTTNSILEGLLKSESISQPVKKELEGEAKFLRAFFYFYLVNFYGDVPLVLSTDWKTNSTIARTAKEDVWKQIISDLKDAENLLSDKYLNGDAQTPYAAGSEERVRPNKWAASALLARAYLYTGDWPSAEAEATLIINNSTYFQLLSDLNSVFLKNSKEAIWQLMPVNPSISTQDAPFLILTASGPNTFRPSYLSSYLLNAFEPNDKRRTIGNWVNSVTVSGTTYFFPYKYKVRILTGTPTEYPMVFRLAEQYLIRAEARAKQNNLSAAASDLNIIRNRAALPNIDNATASSQSALLNAIFHERQVELFTEWSNRWFDLKRTGNIDAVMNVVTPQKLIGSTWQQYKQLFPLSFADIQNNPNLKQNPGY